MQTPTAAAQDAALRDLLGDELDAAALPLPPRVPTFAAETVRPGKVAS